MERADGRLELAAAVLVAREEVEALVRGAEQGHVARYAYDGANVAADKCVRHSVDSPTQLAVAKWCAVRDDRRAFRELLCGAVEELSDVHAGVPLQSVNFEAVSLDHVMVAVEGAKRLHLVLLDACRENPFARTMQRTASLASRSIVSRGLASIEPEAGTMVVYAARAGEVAMDGVGDHSPFATALINNFKKPKVEIRKLFDIVRDDVWTATKHQQQPFTYGSPPGREDFFFVAGK